MANLFQPNLYVPHSLPLPESHLQQDRLIQENAWSLVITESVDSSLEPDVELYSLIFTFVKHAIVIQGQVLRFFTILNTINNNGDIYSQDCWEVLEVGPPQSFDH